MGSTISMWENIRSNKRKSVLLFVFMGALLLTFGYVFGRVYIGEEQGGIGIIAASVIWFILSVISIFSGDSIILKISGARRVEPQYLPQLSNVVEEMSIAAGLPACPAVYIIQDDAPNAFAVGKSPDKSAIAVTTGLLTLLDRDELQAVIAHETAHIANSDAMFMTFSGIILSSISFAAEVFLRSFGLGGSRKNSLGYSDSIGPVHYLFKILVIGFIFSAVRAVLGSVVLALAASIIIPYLVRILFFSVSRKREFLADASAVQLTRYPEGLASALEKISMNEYEQRSVNSINAAMCIVNPFSRTAMSAWNIGKTHPSINERIQILRNMTGQAQAATYPESFRTTTGRRNRRLQKMNSLQELFAIRPPADNETCSASENHRAVQDSVHKLNNYSFIECACGMKLKIPSGFGMNKPQLTCPKCGSLHRL